MEEEVEKYAKNKVLFDEDDFIEFEKKVNLLQDIISGKVDDSIEKDFSLKKYVTETTVITKNDGTSKPVKNTKKSNSINASSVTPKPSNCVTSLTHLTEPTMDQEAFMKTVEEDANKRARERRERNERSDELKLKGNAAYKEGQLEKALLFYNQALEIRKDSSILYCNRAITHLKLGLYTKACQDCDSAIKLKPLYRAYMLKSKALYEMGEVAASDQCLQEARERFSTMERSILDYQAEWKKTE